MASDATITFTGLDDLRRAVVQLPAAVTAALRTTAEATAVRIQAGARTRLLAQLKTPARALADAITIFEDLPNRQWTVESVPSNNIGRYRGRLVSQPLNVPIWNEYGTRKMAARPYMRPAVAAEQARYLAEVEARTVGVLSQALG